MNNFKNLSIQSKIAIVFSIILGITLSSYGLVIFFNNKQKSDAILVDISGKNRMLSQRIGAMAQLVGCSNGNIASRAKEELALAVQSHQNALNVLRDGGALQGMEPSVRLPAATGAIKDKINEIDSYFQQHKELVATLLNEAKYVEEKSDSGTTSSIENPVFNKALTELQDRLINGTMLKHNMELTSMYVGKSKETKESFILILITLFILNVSCIGVGYLFFTKNISEPIQYLSILSEKISKGDASIVSTYSSGDNIGQISRSINLLTENIRKSAEFTIKIGNGDFTANMDLSSSENVKEEQNLALALTNMKNRLVQVAEDDKKRKWVAEGLAYFGDILRANQSLDVLSNTLLSELIRYIQANQGGLFILTEEEQQVQLDLVACYAYNRKKFLNKTVHVREGLLGQVLVEKDKIFLTEVPENYVNITSGLGEATPRCILILPLKNNDIIEGVLEIASFHILQDHEIQFVEKVAEGIASAFSNIRVNERTKSLLQDSQRQSEELKAQEEEMRQNMEEMQATQEEMKRRTDELNKTHAEMSGIMKVIDFSMINIEFQPDGTIVNANDNFLKTMKYSLENIKGKHHRMFAPKEVLASEDYKTFWTRLSSGESFTGIFKRITSTGETVWFNAIYNSIKDDAGNVVKVVKFANDITLQQELVAESKGILSGVNATMATIEFQPNGTIITVNANFQQTMKYTLENLVGNHHRMFVPGSVLESDDYKTFWSRLASGVPLAGVFKRISSTGDIVWLNAIYNPIFNASGEVVRVVKFAIDVTKEKQKELETAQLLEETRSQEEELRQMMEELQSTQEGVERILAERTFDLKVREDVFGETSILSESDLYGTILYANSKLAAVSKYTMEELVGKPHNIFRHPDMPKELFKLFWETIKKGETFKGIIKNKAKDGSHYWVDGSFVPVKDANGTIIKYIGARYHIVDDAMATNMYNQQAKKLGLPQL